MPNNTNRKLESLYAELGGSGKAPERIEKILRHFYEFISKDTMIGYFFFGKNLEHIITQQKTFLLKAMGEKGVYRGKSIGQAHQNIPPILNGHFDRRLLLLKKILKDEGLSDAGVEAWVSFEEQFRKAIVKEEGPLH